ncbi:MAG: hypothetical protein P8179_01150 [Candidatus Thiodiazotropha sp.]
MTIIEACSGQETRRNAQGMARPFQALQRSILAPPAHQTEHSRWHHSYLHQERANQTPQALLPGHQTPAHA